MSNGVNTFWVGALLVNLRRTLHICSKIGVVLGDLSKTVTTELHHTRCPTCKLTSVVTEMDPNVANLSALSSETSKKSEHKQDKWIYIYIYGYII